MARDPHKVYAGRRPDVAVLNFSLSREYAEKLRTWSGGAGGKRLGKFVEQLARDYELRQRLEAREERLLQLEARLEEKYAEAQQA